METIIFSYNRPAQLDLLLRSIKKFTDFDDIIVLYLNEPGFEYDTVIVEHPEVKFVYREKGLKYHLLKALHAHTTMFLCDDDIFINKVSLKDRQFFIFSERPEVLCLSLRLSKTMDYHFDGDVKVEIPEFDEDGCWLWFYYPHDWGYPMSLSGHLFRTEEIKLLLERLEYDNPTQLEGQMAITPLDKPLMICYPTQKVVEAPINIVQNECFTNRTGNISAESLNNEFKKGKRIDLNSILKEKFIGVHQFIGVKWK